MQERDLRGLQREATVSSLSSHRRVSSRSENTTRRSVAFVGDHPNDGSCRRRLSR